MIDNVKEKLKKQLLSVSKRIFQKDVTLLN